MEKNSKFSFLLHYQNIENNYKEQKKKSTIKDIADKKMKINFVACASISKTSTNIDLCTTLTDIHSPWFFESKSSIASHVCHNKDLSLADSHRSSLLPTKNMNMLKQPRKILATNIFSQHSYNNQQKADPLPILLTKYRSVCLSSIGLKLWNTVGLPLY